MFHKQDSSENTMTPVFLSVFLCCSNQERLMNESQGNHFCWPRDVYDSMPISSIVVYVLLVTQNLLPIYIPVSYTHLTLPTICSV